MPTPDRASIGWPSRDAAKTARVGFAALVGPPRRYTALEDRRGIELPCYPIRSRAAPMIVSESMPWCS